MFSAIIKNTLILDRPLCHKRLSSSLARKDWNGKAKNIIYLSGLALTTGTFFLASKYFSRSEEDQLEERLTIVQKLKGSLEKEQKLLQEDLLKRKSSKP